MLVCLISYMYPISHIPYHLSFICNLLFISISSLIYLYLSSLSISHFSLDFFHPRRVFTHSLTHSHTHRNTHKLCPQQPQPHKKAQPAVRAEKEDDTKKNVLPAFGSWRRRCRWTWRSFPETEIADQKVRQLLFFFFVFFCSCCTQILTQFLMHVES